MSERLASDTTEKRSRKRRITVESMQAAISRGAEFRARILDAKGCGPALALLMTEAIAMNREARGLEPVDRDGRHRILIEELESFYCMDAARAAYLECEKSKTDDFSGH